MEVSDGFSDRAEQVMAGLEDQRELARGLQLALPEIAALDLRIAVSCRDQTAGDQLLGYCVRSLCRRAVHRDGDDHLWGFPL